MSKVVATTVLPEDSGEVLTFGDTGDAIAISGNSLNLNILQDAGGNNIFTSDGSGTISSTALGGAMNLLATNTFTDSASSVFTTLIDSTYDVYIWMFNALNPDTNSTRFQFQCSTDGGSNYNTTVTSTTFKAYHSEDNASAALAYDTYTDQSQGTAYQDIQGDIGNGADQCGVGELYLFSPSSTTYVKHFYSTVTAYDSVPQARETLAGGYFNTTSAINALSFKMLSGNMDGEIKMYGISKS